MKWLVGISVLAFASAVAAQQPITPNWSMPSVESFQRMQLTPEQDDKLSSDAFSLMSFATLHQLGHGVLPAWVSTPLNEGDYDDFAVFLLTEGVKRGDIGDIADLTEAVGTAWAAWWAVYQAGLVSPYWLEHEVNEQRVHRIACLLHGSDQKQFDDLPGQLDVPAEQIKECPAQYQQMRQTWLDRLEGHLRTDQDPQDIEVRFPQVQHALSSAFQDYLQEEEYLEVVGETISQTLRLDRPVSLEVSECGTPTTQWDEGSRTVRICSELLADLFTTMAPQSTTQQMPPTEGTMRLPAPEPVMPWPEPPPPLPQYPVPTQPFPTPQQPSQGPIPQQLPMIPGGPLIPPSVQPPQQQPSLVGTWTMTMTDQHGAPMHYQLTLHPNGQYVTSVQSSQGRVDSWGAYVVQPGMMLFTMHGSNVPFTQVGTQIPMYYQQVGPNQIQVPEGILQRTQ